MRGKKQCLLPIDMTSPKMIMGLSLINVRLDSDVRIYLESRAVIC